MNRVVHFEIQADDPERAIAFYKSVFNWEIQKYEGDLGWDYWMIMTAPKDSKELGINGGLHKRPAAAPEQNMNANAFVCTMEVKDFDETAQKIKNAGGKVGMPKFEIAGMAWQGYFFDTEGNTFGIHQPLK